MPPDALAKFFHSNMQGNIIRFKTGGVKKNGENRTDPKNHRKLLQDYKLVPLTNLHLLDLNNQNLSPLLPGCH